MRDDIIHLILSCPDEAETLPWVLGRMSPRARAIVVDNGSRDGSPALAMSPGATVVEVSQRGYGSACHAGLLSATSGVVAFRDADASLHPGQLALLRAALADGVDLVVGCRRPVSASAWSWRLRMATRVVCRQLRRRTGLALADLGPMPLARRVPLLALGIEDRRSGYPLETVVRAAEHGWRVASADVNYRPSAGRSTVTGTPLGALRAVTDMTRILSS